VRYLDEFPADQCGGHERRYAVSLEWVAPLLTPGATIVGFGRGECPFETAARRLFPATITTTRDDDLRYYLRLEDASADGILLMETLEHMKDRDGDPVDIVCHTGIRNVLAEALRILKPGGWLFLTTPNAGQYGCAWRLVRGDSPTWCDAHAHEFAWNELRWFLTTAGFRIDRIEAVDCWMDLECPAELRAVMDALCPDIPRGHAIFCLARKPEAAP